MTMEAALYLVPVELSGAPTSRVIPQWNIEVARQIRVWIVENVRTARRFLRRWDHAYPIDECTFFELNGHTDPTRTGSYLDALRRGEPVGLMSEAGCPAIADPGAAVVEIAQREKLKVVPLVGPSSILMSLMASGFNGQGFAFNGYLPIDEAEKSRELRELENRASRGQTQIFIETPYRNNRLISFLSETLRPDTLLCVAADITDPQKESIVTMPAARWKSVKADYDKRPAIFLIHREGAASAPRRKNTADCRKNRKSGK